MSKPSIDERFARFAEENPEILEQLVSLALSAQSRGYKRYSIKGLWEVLRYRADPVTAERYKLSNDFTSRYARAVMAADERLAGFFQTKTLATWRERLPRNQDEDQDLAYYVSDFI